MEMIPEYFQSEEWGRIGYGEALERQQQIFDTAVRAKLRGDRIVNRWIWCEHPPVFTLGKHGKADNLLLSADRLNAEGIGVFRTDRGGDITFHGYGQVVAYPILDIDALGLGLKQYIHILEEAVIRTLSEEGLCTGRLEGATGVWLDAYTPQARKICAIGVRSSHFITMHGFALNVNTDLRYFSYIHPCGFTDKGVTSVAAETGRPVDERKIKERILVHARRLFLPGRD